LLPEVPLPVPALPVICEPVPAFPEPEPVLPDPVDPLQAIHPLRQTNSAKSWFNRADIRTS
jgi:hypothetical protein